ncbi:MAG: N-acetyltransferase [Nitrospirae bacterium]|nr:N-acetyltransferase [Nitrospirota bacterium]
MEIYNEAIQDGTANCELGGVTLEQRLDWFRAHNERYPLWVAELGGTVVGWTCLSQYDQKPCFADTATFSTYVAARYRGRHIGNRLRVHLIKQARGLGYCTIVNRVFEENVASIELAKKYGFEKVGHMKKVASRNGEYWDCVFYQLILKKE